MANGETQCTFSTRMALGLQIDGFLWRTVNAIVRSLDGLDLMANCKLCR